MNPMRLGIITYLAIPAFFAMYFLGGAEPVHLLREVIFMILMLSFMSLVCYYLVLVYRNKALNTGSRNLWFLLILLFHLVAMPIYWHKFIKPNLGLA